MGIWTSRAAVLLAAVALAACGDMAPAPADRQGGSTRVATATDGAPTAGRRTEPRNRQQPQSSAVAAQSTQFDALRASIGSETQAYNAAVAAITERLQAGTTPTNPVLVERWNEAQAHLDKITADLGRLNSLAGQLARPVTDDAALRRVRAAGGDNSRIRQDRLAAEIDGEIARQNSFLLAERPNLANLGYAVKAGRLGTMRTAGSPGR
jgi:hypothetical protein